MTERSLLIDGLVNFRDLGGFAAGSKKTRPGALFRSSALHELSERGMGQLDELGVVRVVDLRDDNERKFAPNRLSPTATLLASPIFPSASAHIAEKMDVHRLTELIYFRYGPQLAATLAKLAEEGAGPTVINCTAGKDRTGAVSALTLLSIGVDRDDVLHDYAQSEKNLAGEWKEAHLARLRELGFEITPAVEGLVSGSPIEALEVVLRQLESEYGSVHDYLIAHGIEESTLTDLHERFLD